TGETRGLGQVPEHDSRIAASARLDCARAHQSGRVHSRNVRHFYRNCRLRRPTTAARLALRSTSEPAGQVRYVHSRQHPTLTSPTPTRLEIYRCCCHDNKMPFRQSPYLGCECLKTPGRTLTRCRKTPLLHRNSTECSTDSRLSYPSN